VQRTWSASERLVVAVDTADIQHAVALAGAVLPFCGMYKLGLEFFAAHGAVGVSAFTQRPICLDLKLHDIPNTVSRAVRALLPLKPRILTIHAAGGTAMVEAARRASETGSSDRPLLLAITVLTSLTGADLSAMGISGAPATQALRLAQLALRAGADGLVCSPLEVAALRDAIGPEPLLLVPGIRPKGSSPSDQARFMTPREAIDAGADWIVVGRPVTSHADPGGAARTIVEQLR
jgi:orotidine-5'-phosphate decarboxylase